MIIVIIALFAGIFVLMSLSEDILIAIPDKNVVEWGKLHINLYDSSKTALSDKELHVTVFDSNGKEVLKQSGVTSDGVKSLLNLKISVLEIILLM